jgi:hypothetical protein
MHNLLYWRCVTDGLHEVSKFINNSPGQTIKFLEEHLQNDWKILKEIHGNLNDDNLASLFHCISFQMKVINLKQFDALHTEEERVHWETEFHQKITAPVFENIPESIKKANETKAAGKLMKMATESLPLEFYSTDERNQIFPLLTCHPLEICWEKLSHCFHNNPRNQSNYPIISHFLNSKDTLFLIR